MAASKKGSSDEATKVIQGLVSALSKDPKALSEFKKNPAAAIESLLGDKDVSEETTKKVKSAVKEHGEGADLASLVGSLGALFGDSHSEATANHEAAGNPLNALAALLLGGNHSNASSAGNILGMLGSVFGSANGKGKGKGKGGMDAGDLVGMLGNLLGGK